jgi:hypothetical protein
MLSDLKEKLYFECFSNLHGRGVKYETYIAMLFLFKNIVPNLGICVINTSNFANWYLNGGLIH